MADIRPKWLALVQRALKPPWRPPRSQLTVRLIARYQQERPFWRSRVWVCEAEASRRFEVAIEDVDLSAVEIGCVEKSTIAVRRDGEPLVDRPASRIIDRDKGLRCSNSVAPAGNCSVFGVENKVRAAGLEIWVRGRQTVCDDEEVRITVEHLAGRVRGTGSVGDRDGRGGRHLYPGRSI